MRYNLDEKKVTVLNLYGKGHSVSSIATYLCTTTDFVFKVIENYEVKNNEAIAKAN